MDNPICIAFTSLDAGDFNPNSDPRPENWDSNMPGVKPHIAHLEDYDGEIRIMLPGLDIWLKKHDLAALIN